jgi:hypothetical protein
VSMLLTYIYLIQHWHIHHFHLPIGNIKNLRNIISRPTTDQPPQATLSACNKNAPGMLFVQSLLLYNTALLQPI